jgi:hypothetical protein
MSKILARAGRYPNIFNGANDRERLMSIVMKSGWHIAAVLVMGNAISASAARGATDVFSLSANIEDLADYYPTYLANGYFSLASSPLGSEGTDSLMAGLVDHSPGDVSRPAAVPRWNEIDYFDGERWLNAQAISPETHAAYQQTLNMRDGVLRTRYQWRSGTRRSDVAVTSFVSQADPHLAVVTLEVTPHFAGTIRLRFSLQPQAEPKRFKLAEMDEAQFTVAALEANAADAARGGKRNAIWYPGHVTVRNHGVDSERRLLWLSGTADGGDAMQLAAAIEVPAGMRSRQEAVQDSQNSVVLEISGEVQSGHHYEISKFVAASAQSWGAQNSEVRALAAQARARGWKQLFAAHAAAWHALWRADIEVSADPELQRTIHSDLFYLLQNTTRDQPWAVGACGFSAHYFGHVFWDNDLWVFPALLLLHPERARGLVEFRSRFLAQAQARARSHQFDGAMYPWEADSATGLDVTPHFAQENADQEVHVNGAVALAQWQYYLASGDRAWLRRVGYPAIAAVADFWASRASWNDQRGRFELLNVTSPEEDYVHVNNEIYTNAVAHTSLVIAMQAATLLGATPGARWAQVAAGLYLPSQGSQGVYFDFDPTTPHDKTSSWMATSIPMLSIPALNFDADGDTLQGLFRHSVDAVSKVRDRANQMILVMLALEAAKVGDVAYFKDVIGGGGRSDPFLKPPFNVRSETPQNDSTYLLASSGGFLQAFEYGLTGLRFGAEGLEATYPASLPASMRSLRLRGARSRGATLDVFVVRDSQGTVRRILRRRRG